MKNIVCVWFAAVVMFILAGCNSETVPIPEYVPGVPGSAKQVLGHDYVSNGTDYWAAEGAARAGARVAARADTPPEVVGILPKNIQNLLCNSVHHAIDGRQDQAAHKLDMAKNDKLVKLLSKGDITQAQYTELDNWMAELIELLYSNFAGYPNVQRSFPFDCAGQNEETESVGEVVETDILDDPLPTESTDPIETAEPGDNADRFIKKVCFSTFAAEDHDYLGAANYLVNADLLALYIFHDPAVSEAYKQNLRGWLHKIHEVLILHTSQYTSTNMPFSCARYQASYTPSGVTSSISQAANVSVGVVSKIVQDIADFIRSIF